MQRVTRLTVTSMWRTSHHTEVARCRFNVQLQRRSTGVGQDHTILLIGATELKKATVAIATAVHQVIECTAGKVYTTVPQNNHRSCRRCYVRFFMK